MFILWYIWFVIIVGIMLGRITHLSLAAGDKSHDRRSGVASLAVRNNHRVVTLKYGYT